MSTIFLSHSSADNPLAGQFKASIAAFGHTVFLDFDVDDGIRGGADWERTLYDRLQRCQVVVALLTPAWLASKWCFAEVVQARAAGKIVVPIKAAACDAAAVFPDTQQIDFTADEAQARQRLEAALRDVVEWRRDRPPYPGLLAFHGDDEAVFFGRDPEVVSACETLEALRHSRAVEGRFVLVLGASGSGKSSLVRAGVLPRLRRRPEHWLVAPVFRPGLDPVDELAMALATAYERVGASREWHLLRDRLQRAADPGASSASPLVEIARDLLVRAGRPEATLLVTIDQAEELFGAARADRADQFLQGLRTALMDSAPPLMVVATMRSDFLPQFQGHPFVVAPRYPDPLRYETVTVEPMPVARFREVILGPARLAGIEVAPELVERMIADTGSRDALPLLAFVLRKLWDREQRGGDNRFELHEYLALGGVAGAVRQAADEAFRAGHPGPDDIAALHEAFVPTLVRVTAEGDRIRRRAHRDEIPRRADKIVGDFVDRRLLISDTDRDGRETIEVAHEALLRTWQQLDEWIEADFEKLRLLETIRRHAGEWQAGERSPELLLHFGERLAQALELRREARFGLQQADVEVDYLDACQAAEKARIEAEREEQERRLQDAQRIAQEQRKLAAARKTTTQRTLIGLALSLVLAAAAGWQYFSARQAEQVALGAQAVAERQRQEAVTASEEARAAKEEAVPWIIRATWRSGADYQREPGYVTGVRKLIEHADPIINLDKLRFLSPVPIFESGPHDSKFDWDAKSFAHYNPAFVQWISKNMIPGADDAVFRAATQAVYDAHLSTLAHAYCTAYAMLHNDPNVLEGLTRAYLASVEAGQPVINLPLFDQFFQAMDALRGGVFPYYASVAAGFWIRRRIDGTDEAFIGAIRKLLDTYDQPFAKQCAGITRPFSQSMAEALPGVWLVEVWPGDRGEPGRAFAVFHTDGRLTVRRADGATEHRWEFVDAQQIRVDGRPVTYSSGHWPIDVSWLPGLSGGKIRLARLQAGPPLPRDEPGVDCTNAREITTTLGTFRRLDDRTWLGPDDRGNAMRYEEIGRRSWSLHLYDPRRRADIELNSGQRMVTIGTGAGPRQTLGQVTGLTD